MPQQARGQQEHQDDETVAPGAHIGPGGARRQEIGHDLAAVQRRDGQQVDPGEAEVDVHPGHQHEQEVARGVRDVGAGQHGHHGAQDKSKADGQQKVGHGPGQGHPHHVAGGVAQVAHIDRHRLGPAEDEARAQTGEQEHGRAQGVEMRDGIEGQAAHEAGGLVPLAGGHPAVGHFMHDDAEQGGDQVDSEALCVECKIEHLPQVPCNGSNVDTRGPGGEMRGVLCLGEE